MGETLEGMNTARRELSDAQYYYSNEPTYENKVLILVKRSVLNCARIRHRDARDLARDLRIRATFHAIR